ncbi:MAG: hypothetical protein ABSB59_06095 [Streptosporangiaceae bacterium]|jgi:hypothetical protein
MVTPYLSRLRPAEPGPRLRPRPRSRFEPAPTFPIDGPTGTSLGLDRPVPAEAEPGGTEAEFEQDPAYRRPAAPAAGPDTGGDQALPHVRLEAAPPGHAARPRSPRAAQAVPPADDGRRDNPADRHVAHHRPAGPEDGPPPPAPDGPAPGAPPPRLAPVRPAAAVGVWPAGPSVQPAGEPAELRRIRPEDAPGTVSVTPGPGREPRQAPPDRAPAAAGRPGPGALPAPPFPPAERPSNRADRASRADQAGQPAGTPSDHVQAMARWLRDAAPAPARAEVTMPPGSPRYVPPARVPDRPAPAASSDVTVTIGRIEVKMPAAEPAPGRRSPAEPGRRVPSLGDYLESRTRARGRPG